MRTAKLIPALLKRFRRRLAHVDAVPQLALLGILAGVVTGLIMVLFRYAIEWPAELLLPGNNPENFEGLPTWQRFALPVMGATLLGLMLSRFAGHRLKIGVIHVMERYAKHQGHLPLSNGILQFFTAAFALATGQSGGREGPAVHLGAAGSSVLGQWLRLPNNSIRTLVGCGIAAAISASFNTPIAGVIFAMEVIMLEYTIRGFMPIILASVSATLISQIFFGSSPAFQVPDFNMVSLWEIPYVILMGIAAGTVAAAFTFSVSYLQRFNTIPLWQRLAFAGLITGIVATFVPQVMGIGYDSVNDALLGQTPITILFLLCVTKLALTAINVGLGMPVGLIGPTLVIGAALGGFFGTASGYFVDSELSHVGFYALLGMAAIMGSILQAPLAALMAILELTANPNIVMPCLLIIAVASMTSSEWFKQPSVFIAMLKQQGLNYQFDPITQSLQRASVASIMERNFSRNNRYIGFNEAEAILNNEPRWILIESENKPIALLRAADLSHFMTSTKQKLKEDEITIDDTSDNMIDLLDIPGMRHDVVSLHLQSTLHAALEKLNETGMEALYVQRTTAPMISPIVGIVTREAIENYYHIRN